MTEILVTAGARRLTDPVAFWNKARDITGRVNSVQLDTVNALLSAASKWPISWLAYGLATAWHEARLTPQAEWGKGAGRPYAKPGKYGQPQYGRGLVQLTWDRNYEWADKALGLNGSLLSDFDLALRSDIATRILVDGMEQGAFTGRSLAKTLPTSWGTIDQFKASRGIINGTDRADDIAEYALRFQDALHAGGWG